MPVRARTHSRGGQHRAASQFQGTRASRVGMDEGASSRRKKKQPHVFVPRRLLLRGFETHTPLWSISGDGAALRGPWACVGAVRHVVWPLKVRNPCAVSSRMPGESEVTESGTTA
jgi:hypothetical protein